MSCVNRNLPEFRALTDLSGMSPKALASVVSVWLDNNPDETFPTMKDLFGEGKERVSANSFQKGMIEQIQSEISFVDENGNPCAANGLKFTGFRFGGSWEIVKKFKGPSHSQGGIDIQLSDSGVRLSNKDGQVKAADGMIIPADPPDKKSKVRFLVGDNIKEYDVNSPEYLKDYSNLNLKNYTKDHQTGVYIPKEKPKEYKNALDQINDDPIINTMKIVDPTGISSYKDVYDKWTDGKFNKEDIIETVGALPVLGKVAVPFKLAKGASRASKALKVLDKAGEVATKIEKAVPNTLEAIGDINKILKRKSPIYDALGKVGKGINESTEMVSSKVTDLLERTISSKAIATMDHLPREEKINALVNILNISNLTADTKSAIESWIDSKSKK